MKLPERIALAQEVCRLTFRATRLLIAGSERRGYQYRASLLSVENLLSKAYAKVAAARALEDAEKEDPPASEAPQPKTSALRRRHH